MVVEFFIRIVIENMRVHKDRIFTVLCGSNIWVKEKLGSANVSQSDKCHALTVKHLWILQ